MNAKTARPNGSAPCDSVEAFTLLELLVILGVISILAGLLLPVLSRARAQGQAACCRNNLHPIGVGLAMYVADYNRYPGVFDWEHGPSFFDTWADKLYPYYPLHWTNVSWNCPTYVAEGGTIRFMRPDYDARKSKFEFSCSYGYNAQGTGARSAEPRLGLANAYAHRGIREQQVEAPSEMYAIADVRAEKFNNGVSGGAAMMIPWNFPPGFVMPELKPPHDEGYNILFADGHVSLVKRSDYLYPPRSAHHWNRDNQPHPETWRPMNEWAVQN
jgi:prepilin-type processing-associated H-X9-DG protein